MHSVTIHDTTEDGSLLSFDVNDILTALGERAKKSHWLCHGVECFGPNAGELHALSDNELPVIGGELLHITANVEQTIDGYFEAFQENESEPWLVIRAIDGGCFEVESPESDILHLLQRRFHSIVSFPEIPPLEPLYDTRLSGVQQPEWTDQIRVRLDESLPHVVASLRRIQTEGDNISENFVILISDEKRNYYIQFAAGHDDTPFGRDVESLYAEATGNEILAQEFTLNAGQVAGLQALGWKLPSHSPNFYRTWKATNDSDRQAIAREVILALTDVYHIAPTQPIEIQVMIV